MIGRAGMVVLFLVTLGARADEPGAPLENTRQELKSLDKKSHPHDGDDAVGKLRESMPQIQAPVSDALPFEMPKSKKQQDELKKKKESQQNWLLEGMDKLDKPAKGKDADQKAEAAKVTSEDDKTEETTAPDLMTLYSEQKKTSDTKSDAKRAKTAQRDPMTPFLQGWLADSPVRGKFFDDSIKRPDSGPVPTGANGPMPLPDNSSGPVFSTIDLSGTSQRNASTGPTPVQPNPYLQGLDMPFLQGNTDSGSRQPATSVGPQTGPIPVITPLADSGQTTKVPDKKPLFPLQSDDKKYFPQLNKF